MSKRIYALAKELSLDSREVIDLCLKLGIPLKQSSALDSLEADEVEKIQNYLKKRPVHPTGQPVRPTVFDLRTPEASVANDPMIRICNLAKQLRINSKDLVDALLKAGVKSVCSALASLNEKDLIALAEGKSSSVEIKTILPMCLSNALAIDALHVQVAEVGAIVESLILKVLDSQPNFRGESQFCQLIDDAFQADVFSSLKDSDLHSARIVRNKVVHRNNGFPSQAELRQSRNAFVLAILDLLEYCCEPLKAEVLSEFVQYLPANKRII